MKNKIFTRGMRVRTPDVHNSLFDFWPLVNTYLGLHSFNIFS